MIAIVIKTVILFLFLLLVIRVMGKRQIGEMQPFEFVLTLIVAEVVCIPMTDPAIPLAYGLIPIFALAVVHFLLILLARKSLFARGMFCGKPVIIINPDGIDYKNLKALNMTLDDLLELLNGEGYFNLDEIQYAVLETNGKMCIMPKAEYQPLVAKDINVVGEPTSLALPIVMDGKFIKNHIEKMNVTEEQIKKQLNLCKLHDLKEVALITLNNSGKLFIQPKNAKFQIRTLSNYNGGSI